MAKPDENDPADLEDLLSWAAAILFFGVLLVIGSVVGVAALSG